MPHSITFRICGERWNRTTDHLGFTQTLYQLSYFSILYINKILHLRILYSGGRGARTPNPVKDNCFQDSLLTNSHFLRFVVETGFEPVSSESKSEILTVRRLNILRLKDETRRIQCVFTMRLYFVHPTGLEPAISG